MKKKIVFSIIIGMIVLVNIIAFFLVNKENSILKNRLFIFEGTSYYAVNDTDVANVSFILIDSKNTITEKYKEDILGVLYGEDEKEKQLTDITIEKLDEYKSYSVYSVSGVAEGKDLEFGEHYYTSLCIKDESGSIIFDLPIGSVLIDKIENTNANEDIEIGYAVNEDEKGQYLLNVDNNLNDVMVVEDISFKQKEKGKISGTWMNGKNSVEGNKKEEDLFYLFNATEDMIYIQAVVYYKVNGKNYSEIAKTATCYLPMLGKQQIIDYIRRNIDGK